MSARWEFMMSCKKSKRIVCLFCALVLVMPLMLLTGCDSIVDFVFGHVHNVDRTVWQCDDDGHWNKCSGCSEKVNYAVHVYETQSSAACKVCGKTRPAPGNEQGGTGNGQGSSGNEQGSSGNGQGGSGNGQGGSGNGQGGSGNGQGGSGNGQGGSGNGQGGSGNEQGSSGNEQGSSGNGQGGSGNGQGGSGNEQGSSGNGQGDSGNEQGGSGNGQGGSGNGQGGSGNGQGGSGNEQGSSGNEQGGSGNEQGGDETSEEITDSEIERRSVSTYGYEWLGKKARGAQLNEFYDDIDALAKKVTSGAADISTITVSGRTYYTAGRVETRTLTQDEMTAVYYIYCYDHPYNFWQGQNVVYGSATSFGVTKRYVHLIVLDAFNTYPKLAAARAEINANIKKLYGAADGADGAYETSAAYYRELAVANDYAYDSYGYPSDAYWAHSIIGVFDNDASTGPVCEGYARAFQLMLNLREVDNVYCIGTATNDGAGGSGGHAWNMAKLDDGRWYYFDLTWDDRVSAEGDSLDYDYFALSATEKRSSEKYFAQSHTAGTSDYRDEYFMYDVPTNVAQTAFAGVEFALGTRASDGSFEYMRNGIATVSVVLVRTSASPVRVPETVELYGKTYTVNEIGPNITSVTDDGIKLYSLIMTDDYNRPVYLPGTVAVIHLGAFYMPRTVNIYYDGTAEDWSKILINEQAFGRTPYVYFTGGEV